MNNLVNFIRQYLRTASLESLEHNHNLVLYPEFKNPVKVFDF